MTWTVPTGPLNMNGVKVFAADTETRDPNLLTSGPGFIKGDSYPIGFSITTDTGERGYFPIAHEEGNCEWDAIGWAKSIFEDPSYTSVWANVSYDLEALWKIGINVKNKLYDIQTIDSLCNENYFSYSLNAIAKRRGFGEKSSAEMEEALVLMGAVAKGKPDYSQLYRLHPKDVGPYAVGDTDLTLEVFKDQQKNIELEELHRVVELESDLIPVLWHMRLQGVPVDFVKAEYENDRLNAALTQQLEAIRTATMPVDPWSSNSLETWLNAMGIKPPRTTKDNPSVSNEWLLAQDDPMLQAMAHYRQGEKIRRDFVEGLVLAQSHKSRVHPQWLSTRGSGMMSGGDANGTRSGRVACIDPNLAQIPARHPVYGPLVRSLFLPEKGERWFKADYSSQEPRITLHYAYVMGLPGSDRVRAEYMADKATDYHTIVMNMVNEVAHNPITRPQAKDINLGLAYGLGKKKMAARLGLSAEQCDVVLGTYHRAVPYVKPLLTKAMDLATKRGYVTTIMGRRRRFDEWEKAGWSTTWEKPIGDYDEAVSKWGKVRRAGTYKALNAVIQGSAAEQMKVAMVECFTNGYKPSVTLYDELGASLGSSGAAKDMAELMETAIEFKVPHQVEGFMADNWAGENKSEL